MKCNWIDAKEWFDITGCLLQFSIECLSYSTFSRLNLFINSYRSICAFSHLTTPPLDCKMRVVLMNI